MATTRSLSTAPLSPAALPASVSGHPAPAGPPARQRLRAVDRDEVVQVADFLPPGATWLPAPQHTLPTLPGHPPMVGYLVLVPADQQPPFLPVAVSGPPAPERGEDAFTVGDPLVRIDPVQRTARIDGRELDLTYLEFELLTHLVTNPNRVHTRDQLVTTVWGYGHVGDGRTVDVHIARLRRKLGPQFRAAIQTVRRVGYKYTPPTAR
ncbi:winged helix-turn-helix domain-containing protein [Streptomyces mangrovisoli]|uniref:Transcriptional regulator n=1 Tax=Streptomyces mangrovisoli TaxID=1428628 RepID=A0A1J4P082_9ACTN|nr:winged helix-turn-helix domain-containing protein [Streptomyces mangrovisoli]OIJ67140.1 transcriptional regulator [Streptomyces mangrovisoli]